VGLPNTVEISINGRKFNIKTDKEPEYVKKLASELEHMIEKIRAGNSKITFDRALVVACLYLLDEREQLRGENERLLSEKSHLLSEKERLVKENESLKTQLYELGEVINKVAEGTKKRFHITRNQTSAP